jgi:lysophospholipase L1-like esterase
MLSEINARVFIIDAIPNSVAINDKIVERTIDGIHRLRRKTEAPILLAANYNLSDSVLRRDEYDKYNRSSRQLKLAYDSLVKEGVKNLYFLPTSDYHFTEDCMIEAVHPNDLGMMAYAKAYERKLREILKEDAPDKRFPPVRQRRERAATNG